MIIVNRVVNSNPGGFHSVKLRFLGENLWSGPRPNEVTLWLPHMKALEIAHNILIALGERGSDA